MKRTAGRVERGNSPGWREGFSVSAHAVRASDPVQPSQHSVRGPSVAALLPDLLWVPSALLALFFLLSYAVDIPSIDQWDGELPFIMKFMNGSAGLKDLVAQQLEHRIATTRTIGALVAWAADWHPRVHLLVNWGLMCASAVNLSILIRRIDGSHGCRRAVANLLGGSMFFGLPQFDLWLNPMMGTWAASKFLLTSGLVVMTSPLSVRVKCLACMGLAFVGTFTSSIGLVLLPVFTGLLLLTSFHASTRLTARWWGLWGATCIALILAYFHGYERPPESITPPASIGSILNFFLCLLGSPFAIGTSVPAATMALLAGLLVLACLVLCCLYAVSALRDASRFEAVMPWCALMAFGLASVSLVTIGRAGQGVEVALASRYLGAPIVIVFALIVLIPWAIDWATDLIGSRAERRLQADSDTDRLSALLIAALCTAATLMHGFYSIQSRNSYEEVRTRLRAAKAAVLFSRSFVDSELLASVWSHKTVRDIESKLDFLDGAHFLRPATFRTAAIEPLRARTAAGLAPLSRGSLEQAVRPAPGRVAFAGWAITPESQRPADVVLLTWEDDATPPTVFGIAPVGGERPDIAQKLASTRYLKSGWGRAFLTQALPQRKCKIRAWSFLVDAGQAFELEGTADWNPE